MWPRAAVTEWAQQVYDYERITAGTGIGKRKRVLAQVSSNIQIETQEEQDDATARTAKKPRQVTSASKGSRRAPQSPSRPLYPNSDLYATPLARRAQPLLQQLPRPPQPFNSAADLRDSVSARSSYASNISGASSAKRQREYSPTKVCIEAHRHSSYAIETSVIVNYTTDLPPSVSSLAADIAGFASGRGILCAEWPGWEKLKSGLAYEDGAMVAPQKATLLGGDVGLEYLSAIHKRAQSKFRRLCSEASWNSGVHDALLQAASAGAVSGDKIWCENVTTAECETHDWLSKKVDFCIAIDTIDEETQHQLWNAGVCTVNHTRYSGVRYTPIAVSIETKPNRDSGMDATLQLQTWARAQIQFLRRYIPDDMLPPALPLVTVQGHEWQMYYLQARQDHAIFWTELKPFGHTGTLRGTYSVIAGLQRLMAWAVEVYWPWFDQYVLSTMLNGDAKAGQVHAETEGEENISKPSFY